MKTKYIHFRHTFPDSLSDGTYKEGKVLPNGGMCVAYQLDDRYQVVGFALARCHKHDNYNKAQGRVKASGRLKSADYFVQVALSEQEFMAKMDELWEETKEQGMSRQ